jgi:HEAT repeat protein
MGFFHRGLPDVERMKKHGDVVGLAQALAHENPQIRDSASRALEGFRFEPKAVRAQATAALIGQLSSPNWHARLSASGLLGRLGGEQAVEPLIAAFNGVGDLQYPAIESLLQHTAIQSLGELGDTRAVEPLIAVLSQRSNIAHATAAVRALGKLGDARAVGALLDVVDVEWSTEPAVSVGELRDAVTPALARILERVDNSMVLSAAGERALTRLVVYPADQIRVWATAALNELVTQGDVRAVEPLIAMLTDGSAAVRARTVTTLGELGDARALKPLTDALKDESSDVQLAAATALGELGDERAVEPLIAALDGIGYLPDRAIQALGKLGDGRAVEPLIAALSRDDMVTSRWPATALGELGDARAVEPLLRLVESPYIPPRDAAVQALIRLNDESAIEQALETLAARGAIELLASLHVPGAADQLLRCLFQSPREMSGLTRIGELRPFGDWTETILRASGYQEFIADSVTLEGSPLGSDEISRVRWGHSTMRGDDAVAYLCASHISLATNILHLVADKPDQVVVVEQETFGNTRRETLSFAYQRQCARDELTGRAGQPYDAGLYLQEGVWDVVPIPPAPHSGANSGVQ